MKISDVFGLVVRITGFLLMIYSLWFIWAGIKSFPMAIISGGDGLQNALNWLGFGGPAFAVGAVCFLFADCIVHVAYRETPSSGSETVVKDLRAAEIFGIVIRVLGVGIFLYAGWYLIYGLEDAIGVSRQESVGEMRSYFAFGIPVAVAGIVLLRVASLVVRFSYPSREAC
jgi:hypothetical protein